MRNPNIKSWQYQRGTLFGCEVREYLLEKFNYQCMYCGKKNVPFEIEHLIPKSKGGTNRIDNLGLSCHECNQKKSNFLLEEFLKKKPSLLKKIKRMMKSSLKDASAVNSTRKYIKRELKKIIKLNTSYGYVTKFNRKQQNYSKDHWIDAACIGKYSGRKVHIPEEFKPLNIKATGRGSRQMCRMDKYGFPRTSSKQSKQVHGFQTGDIVKAVVTNGKKIGTYFGRIAVRSRGNGNIQTSSGLISDINLKYCSLIQKVDGYSYL